jgi:hypothetical protein
MPSSPPPAPTPEPPADEVQISKAERAAIKAAEFISGKIGKYSNAISTAIPALFIGGWQAATKNHDVDKTTKALLYAYLAEGVATGAASGLWVAGPVGATMGGLKAGMIGAAQFDIQQSGGAAATIGEAMGKGVNESMQAHPDASALTRTVRGGAAAVKSGVKASLPVGESMGKGMGCGVVQGLVGAVRELREKDPNAPADNETNLFKQGLATLAGVGGGLLMTLPGLFQGERTTAEQADKNTVKKASTGQMVLIGALIGGSVIGGFVPLLIGTGIGAVTGKILSQQAAKHGVDQAVADNVQGAAERLEKRSPKTADAPYNMARDVVSRSLVGAAAGFKAGFRKARQGALSLFK